MNSTNSEIYDGVDISEFNGVNFSQLPDSIKAIIVRATSNPNRQNRVDAKFSEYADGALNSGRKVGYYSFFYCHSVNGDKVTPDTDEAAAQARFFASTISGKGRHIACVADFEQEGANGQNDNVVIADCKAFMEALKAAFPGEPLMIYTNPSFANQYLKDSYFAQFLLWVANWGVSEPSGCSVWNSWAAWQTSSKGNVSGVSGDVDTDKVCSASFYTKSGSAPAPAPTPAPTTAHQIGEDVVFSTCYASSTDDTDKAIPASRMQKTHGVITRILAGRHNPYLLDDGLCWVNDGDIRGQYSATAPTPAPASAPSGTYTVHTALRGYMTADDAMSGNNPRNTVQPGNYYVFNTHGGAVNVTTQQGEPGSWINPNQDTGSAAPAPAASGTVTFKDGTWYIHSEPNSGSSNLDTVSGGKPYQLLDTTSDGWSHIVAGRLTGYVGPAARA